MKKIEIKQITIENYIDWFTSDDVEREKMKDNLQSYLEEDHVDEMDVLKSMYGFVSKFDKDLKKAYKSIPKKDRPFTYEQFIVAQFSNLL
jgi:GTP cyclohydrolase III